MSPSPGLPNLTDPISGKAPRKETKNSRNLRPQPEISGICLFKYAVTFYPHAAAEGFEVIEPQYTKKMYEDAMFSGSHNMQVILYTTEDFQYSSEGLASIEKAFADLYFAITRNGYPLSLQELVRIYQNLSRLGNIDKKKLITVASRRNIQYDIRFIVENRFITDSAIEFGKILRREE